MAKWTNEIISEGVKKFVAENGRYPSSRDFDLTSYLPSAKQIQRQFPGGLPEMRKLLVPNSPENFRLGEVRSKVAGIAKANSYKYEEEFYHFLTSVVPEIYIHEQKRLRPGNIACDFFVYQNDTTGYAIDLFYANEKFNLYGVLNIKFQRYKNLSIPIVFIVIGDFTQEQIEEALKSKKNPLNPNMRVYTESFFKLNFLQLGNSIALNHI